MSLNPLFDWSGDGPKLDFVLLDYQGKFRLKWSGQVEKSNQEMVVLTAKATRRRAFPEISIEPNDLLRLYVFRDEWFTINEYSTPEHFVKGWYCNICRPAEIFDKRIVSQDLLLDIVVLPDGRYKLLDEDEYQQASKQLGESLVHNIQTAKERLLTMILEKTIPFKALSTIV